MIINIEKTIREYLPLTLHMSLATCVQNQPRVCEVHYVYDDDLNIYFRSTLDRRHSKEIANNSAVAWNIVTQHPREEKPRWVYFEWTAELLSVDNINNLIPQLFIKRFGVSDDIVTDSQKDHGHKFYKITVSNFALFDKKESNPSKKYTLPRQS
jgi:uncharacterized protein YhbP (UPF0306 family)